MSTILKSLKKLEQEKEATKYPAQSSGYAGPGAVSGSGRPSRWTRSTWIRRGLVAILIVGLGASSLYFYRLSQRQVPPGNETAEKSPAPVKKVAKRNIQKSPQNGAPQNSARSVAESQQQPSFQIQPPVRRPAAQQAPEEQPSMPQNIRDSIKPGPSEPASRTPQTGRPPEPTEKPVVQPAKPARKPPIPPKADPDRSRTPRTESGSQKRVFTGSVPNPPAPEKRSPARRQTDAYSELPVLGDGRLKIQAIVWSDVKEDRMAVVNTQILHEGDNVAGYNVVAIRQDDVVVRGDGGGMYRVLFGRP